jgi:hypothetical protein
VVRSITYSATGAQTIASTTVQGSTAQVTISAEGTITLSYFATDQAGNQEQPNTLSVRIDRTPPVTTATPNPAPNSAGWNNANVTVTLTATDSLSGVDHTEYSLDDAGWTAYTGPIAVTTDGVHEVQYRSIDKAGNVEAAPQLAVKIDKTPPEAVVQFDPTTDSLLVFGKDSGSGMPAGPIAPSSSISTSWSRDGAVDNGMPDANTTAELRTYKLTDLAGNATTLVIKVQVLGQHGDRLKARLVSIQYGSPPPVTFASNTEEFHLVLATDGSLSRLDQQVRVGSGHDQQAVDALFDASQAHTDIRVKSPPPPSVVQKPGLDLLQVATLKGQLSILY